MDMDHHRCHLDSSSRWEDSKAQRRWRLVRWCIKASGRFSRIREDPLHLHHLPARITREEAAVLWYLEVLLHHLRLHHHHQQPSLNNKGRHRLDILYRLEVVPLRRSF